MSDLNEVVEEEELPLEFILTYHSYSKVHRGRETLKEYESQIKGGLMDCILRQENSNRILSHLAKAGDSSSEKSKFNVDIEQVESEDRFTARAYAKTPFRKKTFTSYFRIDNGEYKSLGGRLHLKAFPDDLHEDLETEWGPLPAKVSEE